MNKKRLVVLGGGFGGVEVIRRIAKKRSLADHLEVVLVDSRMHHSYHADLYELATLPEEVTDTQGLYATVSIPLKQLAIKFGARFIQDTVTHIHQKEKKVTLKNQTLEYDYLVCALGSVPTYYGISGAAEHSLSLKTTQDALRIRNSLEFLFTRHKDDITKKMISLVVVGGGAAGVEFAAELSGFIKFAVWKHGYPLPKINIKILEAGSRILSGLPEGVGQTAYDRLKQLGVEIEFSSTITGVTNDLVVLADGSQIKYDLLVWTAGIAAYPVPFTTGFPQDRCGRLQVNEHLQLKEYPEVFVIGDGASTGLGETPCDPPTAGAALRQAAFIAELLPYALRNQSLPNYNSVPFEFMVTLGGKYAIYAGKFTVTGFIAYAIRWCKQFIYFQRLLGTTSAINFTWRRMRIYSRND